MTEDNVRREPARHVPGAGVDPNRRFGLPDDAFEQRRPLRGQITKSEARAVSLHCLGLRADSVVWDIGAGTGSIAVEAARIAICGRIYAVDKDVESADLLETNVARHGDDRVSVMIGSAPGVLRELPDPDSVFIGGGGADLPDIVDAAIRRLNTGGRLVANFAAIERANSTYKTLRSADMSPHMTMIASARGRELPDGALRLESMNPVFIVWGEK